MKSVYGPETTTIEVSVKANPGTDSQGRSVDVNFTTQGAEELLDENGNQLVITAKCTIQQLKDNVAPVEEKANDAAQAASDAAAAAQAAQDAIDEHFPPGGEGGGN